MEPRAVRVIAAGAPRLIVNAFERWRTEQGYRSRMWSWFAGWLAFRAGYEAAEKRYRRWPPLRLDRRDTMADLSSACRAGRHEVHEGKDGRRGY